LRYAACKKPPEYTGGFLHAAWQNNLSGAGSPARNGG
jgi:hypothetical protein